MEEESQAPKDNLKSKIVIADRDKIAISKAEIESRYLAGLDFSNTRTLGIPYYATTDDVTKEQFESIMPKKFDSKIDFMQEILKKFQVDLAKAQNTSFRYVWNKFIF